MGHELKSMCFRETRRLLWLTGISFAVIIGFQFIELPRDNPLLALFSASKIQNSSSVAVSPSSVFENFSNVSLYNGLDSVNRTREAAGEIEPDKEPLLEENDEVEDIGEGLLNVTSNEFSQNITDDVVRKANNGSSTFEIIRETEQNFTQKSDTENGVSPEVVIEHNSTTAAGNISSDGSVSSPSPTLPSIVLSPNVTVPDTNATSPVLSVESNTSSVQKDVNIEESGRLRSSSSTSDDKAKSSVKRVSQRKKKEPQRPTSDVFSLADMNQMLLQNRASYQTMRPRWSSAVDKELLDARSQIQNAPILKDGGDLYAPLYRNISTFKRSYELMEKTLKVYVYKDGPKPVFHVPVLKGIYASEGWFMKLMEGNKQFVTKDWRKAHLFYLPFSSRMLEETLYVPNSHNHKNLIRYLKDYLDLIASKYHFWNRTEGADHFLVACHDWAPAETKRHMRNCIRALCNADVKEGFVFGKDVSLPETYVEKPQNTLRNLGGKPASKRSILAFFAGNMHGYLRPILLQHWENKDPDMKIFGPLPKSKRKMNYAQYMKSSKYCICPKGYEVNSPRIVEAIFYECVPVIISDNYVPPFFEILDWESFAIFVAEKDIPNLKNILLSIPNKRYREMQMRVKKVQQHFLWHARPVKYDLFHMILHSVWFNRVFRPMVK